MEGLDLFSCLPEGCISRILSFTSPRDVCSSSATSSIFRSASESDIVWERFLPSDCSVILARSVTQLQFSSKKELYFRLCDLVLIDEGKMSFSLEKASGKKCYILSARKLVIIWEDTPMYWKWTSLPGSRFSEVAQLVRVCWLEIRGKIDAHMLSPKTTYKAYFVFKFVEGAYGLDFPHAEMSVKLAGHASNHTAFLQLDNTRMPGPWNVLDRLNIWRRAHRVPQARSDGWMEIEMGEFFNDEGEEGEVEMSLMEVRGGNWKSGLIIEGIEMRPLM